MDDGKHIEAGLRAGMEYGDKQMMQDPSARVDRRASNDSGGFDKDEIIQSLGMGIAGHFARNADKYRDAGFSSPEHVGATLWAMLAGGAAGAGVAGAAGGGGLAQTLSALWMAGQTKKHSTDVMGPDTPREIANRQSYDASR